MGTVEPANSSVRELRGLHLYHAGRSNCSARVRFLLEEKKLPWTSHYIDIYKRENVSVEYFGINPRGLVPTLVHDGRVIVESNDILMYLESAFPSPGFTPPGEAGRDRMVSWLQRSGDIHLPGIKTYAYARQHAANVVKTREEVELYRSLQKDPELLAFHGKHDLPGRGFSGEDIDKATALVRDALADMEALLENAPWLLGDMFTLADISWAPSITTLQGVGFPVDDYGRVMDWYRRIAGRPAFRRGVTAWRKHIITGVVVVNPAVES